MQNESPSYDSPPDLPSKPFQFVLYFLRLYKLPLIAMVFLELGQAACQILIPNAIKKIIDAIQVAPESIIEESLWVKYQGPILYFVFLSIGILLFSRASGSLLVIMGPSLRRRVRADLYHYLQFHSQRFFSSHFSGSLANRISEVSMSVNHSLWTILFDFWPVLITFTISLTLLFQTHTGLGLTLLIWLSMFVTVSYFLALKCKKLAKEFADARSTVTGKIVDAVTNVMNTKLFTQNDFERQFLGNYLTLEVNKARKTFWFMEKMRWFQFIATLSLQVCMILYAMNVWRLGEITVGQFAMVTSLSLLIIADARNLSRRFLEFFEYIGNITDGVSILITPHEILDDKKSHKLTVSKGEIEYKDVTFQYSEGKKVFNELNLKIYPGQKVGLVGFSGSGKSTFMNLVLRLYDIQGGQILLDNQNIQNVTQDSLRSLVSVIPQEPMLFHRSLMENIRYGKLSATDAEVIEAAKLAHAHDFIVEKQEGYKSLVGERGIKLSGGQRQRIALARAFLKNAPILLMDEATSSLDSYTEKLIQKSLVELMKNKTVLVIAHRLSTISQLDRIVVFHEGKVIEDGTHEQLLNANGHYSKMWSMQAGGFLPSSSEDLAQTETY